MKTSDGQECDHEDQLIPGLCSTCDAWGLTHGQCHDCGAELDDEDAAKEFIHEGPDGLRRCEECHTLAERQYERARREDAYEAYCDQKLSEWKDERGRS